VHMRSTVAAVSSSWEGVRVGRDWELLRMLKAWGLKMQTRFGYTQGPVRVRVRATVRVRVRVRVRG
jgi:hypothetical protein